MLGISELRVPHVLMIAEPRAKSLTRTQNG